MTKIFLCSLLCLASVYASSVKAVEGSLSDPWKHADVGTAIVGKGASIPGTATFENEVFKIQGTMDSWGTADGFHYVWQPIQGDVELVARVTGMDNPGKVNHAKAGLCIREAIDGGSRCVTLCITPVDGTQFCVRETTDGKTVRVKLDPADPNSSVPKEKFPCWLKLVRKGNEFIGYESLDGQTWWMTGQAKLELKVDAMIGLTSSSHTKDTLTTSTIDSVRLTEVQSVREPNAAVK